MLRPPAPCGPASPHQRLDKPLSSPDSHEPIAWAIDTAVSAMKALHALLLLAIVAALLPLAAMAGLYETSADELARFAAPALGAAIGLTLTHFLRIRRRSRD